MAGVKQLLVWLFADTQELGRGHLLHRDYLSVIRIHVFLLSFTHSLLIGVSL